MLIDQSMKKIEQNLKDEVEQKVCFQKESKDNANMAKMLEEENDQLQNQLTTLEIDKAQIKQQFQIAEE